MKHSNPSNFLPALTAGLGITGLVLGRLLYALAVDHRGLLVRSHPLALLLWLLIPAALAVALIDARVTQNPPHAGPNPPAALGHGLAAGCVLLGVLTADAAGLGTAGTVWRIFGLLAALGLLPSARCRLQGRQPGFLCYLALCLFLLTHLVSHYRQWCSDPQILDYLFELLGTGLWMLLAYYCASLQVGLIRPRMKRATGLLTLIFCLAALGTKGNLWLCLGGAVFSGTELICPASATRKEAP